MAEGESEIVAGFHVEYSGVAFAVFFLAEYMNMILISALTRAHVPGRLAGAVAAAQRLAWAARPARRRLPLVRAQGAFVLFCFLWVRATFPRYRYDQVMRLGWKVFIPVTLVWIIFLGAMMQTPWAHLFH